MNLQEKIIVGRVLKSILVTLTDLNREIKNSSNCKES